jgi:hypothetical protein
LGGANVKSEIRKGNQKSELIFLNDTLNMQHVECRILPAGLPAQGGQAGGNVEPILKGKFTKMIEV